MLHVTTVAGAFESCYLMTDKIHYCDSVITDIKEWQIISNLWSARGTCLNICYWNIHHATEVKRSSTGALPV